jgi:predicted CoA-substrate-specific enzyme activase
MVYKVGIDAGSTTLKVVVLDEHNQTIYKTYKRHFSKVRETLLEEIEGLKELLQGQEVKIVLTGSSGYGIAKETSLSFVQEVFVTAYLVKEDMPEVDVVIELGGEDAKIIFLTGGLEERMNSTCAGGTGAFIDQMAVLMNVSPAELDALSHGATTLYPIASRCGVFAKSDIQPLLNQGARKEDLSASIFQSVVDQTIAGLAQGRKIEGNVLFLGGPLFFYKGLQKRFVETLKKDSCYPIFPLDGQSFVALGCARYADKEETTYTYETLLQIFSKKPQQVDKSLRLPPLFENDEDYDAFCKRHASYVLPEGDMATYTGTAYLGIDAGSTTTKIVLLGENNEILYQYYAANEGNPVEVVKKQLEVIYKACEGRIQIRSSGVTGYGEDLILHAFGVDVGTVETVAHFRAAKHFDPLVDFILDIGGQDMKCFKIKDGTIDSIMLNEACSSGCGSFIETFAKQLGYEVRDFAKLGLLAKGPVDLGTRCTVFMNSSVKQAQKEGATVEDVSAGLAISVIKNALYKVIRAKSTNDLGTNIVVQGGTMYNDAILRSLELELGIQVIRPTIAGLMGAFGVALYAKEHQKEKSTLASMQELLKFSHTASSVNCGLCANKCHLTVNKFGDRKFISGNRCERPIKGKEEDLPNLYQFKYQLIRSLEQKEGEKGVIGIPMVLNMYENLPFWSRFFKTLGYGVVLSEPSSKNLYVKGQHTIPSDTVCYPAKLTHGHIESLLDTGVSYIFYPCMAYNVDEGISDNCYNCPVVAYYPELLNANVADLEQTKFIFDYLSLNNKKVLDKALYNILNQYGIQASKKEIKKATEEGYKALDLYREKVLEEGQKAIRYAREQGRQMVVLGGRPYHVDPEINHGLDKMLTGLGAVVLSEDSLSKRAEKPKVKLLNQWTYHARLYHSAKEIGNQEDMHFVHLVSFGCGTDALTSDVVKDLLEESGKLYTQLKIDETSNLGAARIRIRSMFAGAENRRER